MTHIVSSKGEAYFPDVSISGGDTVAFAGSEWTDLEWWISLQAIPLFRIPLIVIAAFAGTRLARRRTLN